MYFPNAKNKDQNKTQYEESKATVFFIPVLKKDLRGTNYKLFLLIFTNKFQSFFPPLISFVIVAIASVGVYISRRKKWK